MSGIESNEKFNQYGHRKDFTSFERILYIQRLIKGTPFGEVRLQGAKKFIFKNLLVSTGRMKKIVFAQVENNLSDLFKIETLALISQRKYKNFNYQKYFLKPLYLNCHILKVTQTSHQTVL